MTEQIPERMRIMDPGWGKSGLFTVCHFPEHRGKFGGVTHMRYLGEMNGHTIKCCEVCGSLL